MWDPAIEWYPKFEGFGDSTRQETSRDFGTL